MGKIALQEEPIALDATAILASGTAIEFVAAPGAGLGIVPLHLFYSNPDTGDKTFDLRVIYKALPI